MQWPPALTPALRALLAAVSSAAVLQAALTAPAAAAGPDLSRLYYIQYCAGCHVMDGSGSARGGIPDLREQLGYYLHSARGRAYLVQVPGSANSPLSDRDLAQLLNWMVPQFSRAQMPTPFVPYTEDEVRVARAARPAAVADLRREIVQELRQAGHAIE